MNRRSEISQLRHLTQLIPHPVRFNLRKIAFSGGDTVCVLCGSRVRTFASHGGGFEVLDRRKVVGGMRRDHDRCPVCHGADRTRMLMMFLESELGAGTRPLSVLHIAPDYGLYLWLRRQSGIDYTGSDIDARRYRHIENMRSADLVCLPFEDDRFDVVICSHVLEHVPDDRKAMREILRVLAPRGHALLLVPLATDGRGTEEDPGIADPAERERRFGQWDHVRLYGQEDFLGRMAENGFDVTVFRPFETDRETATGLRLNPLEILPVGRKPAQN